MSPIVLIVFAPVIVGALAFMALLLGGFAATAWEAAEERAQGRAPTSRSRGSQPLPHGKTYARAA